MAQWSDAVITLGGVELLNKVVEGKRLLLDHAAGGSGVVDAAALMVQSGLKNQKQQFAIVGVSQAERGKKIHVSITNSGLAQGYTLNQLGIWAHIEDEPSRLLCILQDSEGVNIPSESELLDFALDFYAAIAVSNESRIELSVDPSALVSWQTLQEALANCLQLDASGKIPDGLLPDMDYIPTELKGKAGGVASLGTDGKIPLTQLTIDTNLSGTSQNPVQNKVVQEALAGKAASNHAHTAAQVGAAAANHSHTAAQVGAAAANHTHTAASLGINLANLGGCRVVTGIYTGDGLTREATDYNLSTVTGGQFINLGVKPKIVIIIDFSYQAGYASLSGSCQAISTSDLRLFIQSNNEKTNWGGQLDIVDNGFYVGATNRNYLHTNNVASKYAYIAII